MDSGNASTMNVILFTLITSGRPAMPSGKPGMTESANNFWKDRRVFVTGHTGFKGSWASLWLYQLGANVIGISDCEVSLPSNFSVPHDS